jgi:hypothetical protein
MTEVIQDAAAWKHRISTQMKLLIGIVLALALLADTICPTLADPATPAPASAWSEDSVKALALQWFAQMEAGQIDRTQLTPEYSAQLTDDAVEGLSRHLKEFGYGAPPTGAQVLRSGTVDDQTIYVVKLLFPRGDAGSMLVGLNTEGRITGIDILTMAGD